MTFYRFLLRNKSAHVFAYLGRGVVFAAFNLVNSGGGFVVLVV